MSGSLPLGRQHFITPQNFTSSIPSGNPSSGIKTQECHQTIFKPQKRQGCTILPTCSGRAAEVLAARGGETKGLFLPTRVSLERWGDHLLKGGGLFECKLYSRHFRFKASWFQYYEQAISRRDSIFSSESTITVIMQSRWFDEPNFRSCVPEDLCQVVSESWWSWQDQHHPW